MICYTVKWGASGSFGGGLTAIRSPSLVTIILSKLFLLLFLGSSVGTKQFLLGKKVLIWLPSLLPCLLPRCPRSCVRAPG